MTERFELVEQVGKGGMGTVWKARDRDTGQLVALKLLHEMYTNDPDYVARFEREVDVALRIHSPHVVQVYGYGRHRGQPYVAMELVEGESLKDLIRCKAKLTWDETRDLTAQITTGLSAAHAAGVIHRDVKPSNILVTPDGQAKLADFGIARALDMTRLTRGVTTMGTPHYMAPDAETTGASDLYGLGCVMYEMLTGAPPFDGEGTTQVLLGHLRDEPDVLRLPPEARAVVGGLLEKEPGKRTTLPRLLKSLEVSQESEVGPDATNGGEPAHFTPPRETPRSRSNLGLIRLGVAVIWFYVALFSALALANR